jgi:hypothetical protein
MKRILVGGLVIIGGLAILVVVVGLGVGVVYWISKGVPAKTILEADFGGLSSNTYPTTRWRK